MFHWLQILSDDVAVELPGGIHLCGDAQRLHVVLHMPDAHHLHCATPAPLGCITPFQFNLRTVLLRLGPSVHVNHACGNKGGREEKGGQWGETTVPVWVPAGRHASEKAAEFHSSTAISVGSGFVCGARSQGVNPGRMLVEATVKRMHVSALEHDCATQAACQVSGTGVWLESCGWLQM